MFSDVRARALRCIRCGTEFPLDGAFKGCESCARDGRHSNLQVAYDDAEFGKRVRSVAGASQGDIGSMWHYRELLPVDEANIVTLGEGGTPLLAAPRLGAKLGIPDLHLKDESRNPTGSFKDRLAAGAVSAAKQLGRTVITGSSSGNAGASIAAMSARAGMPCVLFTTQKFPLAMKTQMAVFGTLLLAAPTSRDRWTLVEAGVDELGWFPVTVFSYPFFGSNCYGIEGYKTIGYEILDQLGASPDHVVFPVGAGDAYSGAFKGMSEYAAAGVIDRMPAFHAAEVYGPLERTVESGGDVVVEVPVEGPPTVAVSVGSNLSTFQALDALTRSGGTARSASNEEMLAAQRDIAALEGIWVETSSALSVAVLPKLLEAGAIDPSSRVVCVLTSTGLKDPETTASVQSSIPDVEANLDSVIDVLASSYDFHLEPSTP